MKNWIEETDHEQLATWVKHCPAMKLASKLSGEILWANSAFCEWSQYTLSELRRMTWMQLSVPDSNLDSDVTESKLLDAYNPTYSVKKQYIPKGLKPEWGTLTVMRWPLTGDIECCLCTWEPLKNGTATAFAMAMEQSQKVEGKIEAMTAEIRKLTEATTETTWVITTVKMMQTHPKAALMFLIMGLSIFGLNNVVELLQRTGLIQLPVKIEGKSNDNAAVANQIGSLVNSREYLAKDPSGIEVSWSRDFRGTGPLSITDRRTRRGDGPTWTAARPDRGPDVRSGSVSAAASGSESTLSEL